MKTEIHRLKNIKKAIACSVFFASLLNTSLANAQGSLTPAPSLIPETLPSGQVTPIPFSPQEKIRMVERAGPLAKAAGSCLQRFWKEHTEFYGRYGYSKFYGNRHPHHQNADGRQFVLARILWPQLLIESDWRSLERRKIQTLSELERFLKKIDPASIEQLQSIKAELLFREKALEDISCVDLAMRCLGEGFRAAKMKETWDKIEHWVSRPGPDGEKLLYGTDLQKALIDLGWKSYYWNPDPSQNEAWDLADRELNPPEIDPETGKEKWDARWGAYAQRHREVTRKGTYYGVPVHDASLLVGFDRSPPRQFAKVPFFVGTALSGYHVFPGLFGKVVEAHSMRDLRSSENLEVSDFNPLDQENHGGPRWTKKEIYRSGLIVVPPGFLEGGFSLF